MRPTLHHVAAFVAVALLAAGCSSDSDSSSTSAAATSTSAAGSTPASDAATTDGPAPVESSSATSAAPAGDDSSTGVDPDWDAVVAAAEDEGVVLLYTSHLPNQMAGLEEAFEAAYPEIDLQVTRVLGELESTLDAERDTDADGGDVAVNNFPLLPERYLAEDLLLPIDGPHSEAWAGNAAFVEGSFFTANFNALGIAWNTNEVPDGVSSYEELLDPEFEGRVGIPDGSTSAAIIDWWAFVEDQSGDQYLNDLAALDPLVYESAAPLQQAVIVGEVAIAAYAVPSILDEKANGAPVDFVLPDPAWAAPFYGFGLGWSKHPNAARVLIDFMMSPDGQTALAVNGASALEGVTGLTEFSKTVASQVADRPEGFVAEYGATWADIFGR